MRSAGAALALAIWAACAGCDAKLPDPESPGAQLYARRCSGCHRLYAPGVMKYKMWEFWVRRKQGDMVRRGLPPLTREEQALLLDYLKQHSG